MIYVEEEQCTLCKRTWPAHLVKPFWSRHGCEGNYDPICALKRMRLIHGAPHLHFNGTQNKRDYQEARQILKTIQENTTAMKAASKVKK